MAVSVESIEMFCKAITREVEQTYQGLSLMFIVHRKGKMRDAIALAEHEIISHPASRAAQAIIRKESHTERSSFLGIAIANETALFGLKNKDHLLGLFTVNADHFKNELEARGQIFHLVWHAIDLYEIRQDPMYKKKFKSGPMVPKRSPLNLSKANLQADVFAGVLSVLKSINQNPNNEDDSNEETRGGGFGDVGLVRLISQKRGVMSLAPVNDYKAEDFPSVIAIDSCEFVMRELYKSPPPPEDYIQTARKISLDVGQAFDEQNIKQWWDFSIPAQDMAWRGFSREEILGAAVNTSDNPYVRSIAYLIQEVTNISSLSAASLEHSYNSFVDPAMNLKLHREMVDTVFEDILNKAVSSEDTRVFLDEANKQNEALTEGRILGWCASALQEAAKAFENALLNGSEPFQAAKINFEGSKTDDSGWDKLQKLGNNIVNERRQGFAVTMGHIAEICHGNPEFAPILGSLKITMNDPKYVQALQASNDLNLSPSAPAPKGPAPKGPEVDLALGPNVPSTPAATPSLGGNNRAAQLLRQRQLAAQKQKEEQGTSDRAE